MKIPVEFECQGDAVSGRLYLADRDSLLADVLLLPRFPASEEDVLGLGERMSQRGINALTFDYRGTPRSEGVVGFANTLQDIEAAINYLRKEEGIAGRRGIRADRLVLMGLTYGRITSCRSIGHLWRPGPVRWK